MKGSSGLLSFLTEQERGELLSLSKGIDLWPIEARPEQAAPQGVWRVWFVRTGRGWGKNRTASEYLRGEVETGRAFRLALVGRTAREVRETMIEDPDSGILACCERNGVEIPLYEPSRRRLSWSNGAVAHTYSADKPDQLRGPQHDLAWADELASWRFLEAWDNLRFGMRRRVVMRRPLRMPPRDSGAGSETDRQGDDNVVHPRIVVTTTPRPIAIIRRLSDLAQETDSGVVETTGKTEDNIANLDCLSVSDLSDFYDGTRQGRQELGGEILDDVEGALWTREIIENCTIRYAPDELPSFVQTVVAVDPPQKSKQVRGKDPAECGIVAVALGSDNYGYVLGDRSVRGRPEEWGRAVVRAYDEFGADLVVGEENNGGEMVEYVVSSTAQQLYDEDERSTPVVEYDGVRASEGKLTRAEPIAQKYEQGRIRQVGSMPQLEDQLCEWVPGRGKSPDRLDALVWGLTKVMLSSYVLSGPLVIPAFKKVSQWRIH
jgi:phage terminase large subunit-like protein